MSVALGFRIAQYATVERPRARRELVMQVRRGLWGRWSGGLPVCERQAECLWAQTGRTMKRALTR